MGLPIGMTSFADIGTQASTVTAATTAFGTAAAPLLATTAACTPPGNDLDSVRATVQQGVTAANFCGVVGPALAQLYGGAAETTADVAGQSAVQGATSAAVLASF